MNPQERRAIQALVRELWRREGPYVQTHIGDMAWGSTHRSGDAPWRVRLWEERAGAWMRRPAELEYELLPEHRGGPLEHEILDWFEREAEGDALTTYSLSTDAQRLDFLESRGYQVRREATALEYHVRALDELAEIELPPGFRVRTVEPADLERRVAVHRLAVPDRPRLRRRGTRRLVRGLVPRLARRGERRRRARAGRDRAHVPETGLRLGRLPVRAPAPARGGRHASDRLQRHAEGEGPLSVHRLPRARPLACAAQASFVARGLTGTSSAQRGR